MQQNKNLVLAIVLCLVVLFGWGYVTEFMGWNPPEVQKTAQPQQLDPLPLPNSSANSNVQGQPLPMTQSEALPVFTPAEGREIKINTPYYNAVLYTGGGILRSYILKDFTVGIEKQSPLINLIDASVALVAPWGLLVNGQPSWSNGQWSSNGEDLILDKGTKGSIIVTGEVNGFRIVREFTFSADSYLVSEKLQISSLENKAQNVRLGFTVAASKDLAGDETYDPMRIAWNLDGELDDEDDTQELTEQGMQATGNISWAGVMSTYFLNAIAPADISNLTIKSRLQNGIYRTALEKSDVLVLPDTITSMEISYWTGPKLRSLLEKAPNQLASSVDLGMFSLIANALLWIMDLFYVYVHNWGLAIILLTVFVKVLFWPLTAKSYASMAQMKKLQPRIEELKLKYADDREKLGKEQMALFKTYGVNPASGCVPILVQLPVFFGLYQALLTATELRHASFITHLPFTDILWLADLSAKDPFYIAPVLMGISMFLMQRLSPPAGDAMQQKILMMLPVVFTVLFLNFPSGLALYMLVNNLLSLTQQWLMLRKHRVV